MKTTTRSGGDAGPFVYYTALVIAFFSIAGCTQSNQQVKKIAVTPVEEIVKEEFSGQMPIAQLINIGNYTDTSCTFIVKKPAKIQIYALGELIYNLSDCEPEYFLKSDDIEVFFRIKNTKGLDSIVKMNFSWLDGKSSGGKIKFKKNGVSFNGKLKVDSLTSKYIAEIKIPWSLLGVKKPETTTSIEFDTSIGDNDDDYKQEAKISMFSEIDHIFKKGHFGIIRLLGKSSWKALKETLPSYKTTVLKQDTDFAARYLQVEPLAVNKLTMGFVKDKYDLSAQVRSLWDKDNLYLYYEIQDLNRKKIDTANFRQLQTFLDYAWIEDRTGKKVWNMHVLDSKPAGGAIKNRVIDNQIQLSPGEYSLHYTSDESHAYNEWDDLPPRSTFYGVKLYLINKKNN